MECYNFCNRYTLACSQLCFHCASDQSGQCQFRLRMTAQNLHLKCHSANLVTRLEYNVVGIAQHTRCLRHLPNHWMLECHAFLSQVWEHYKLKICFELFYTGLHHFPEVLVCVNACYHLSIRIIFCRQTFLLIMYCTLGLSSHTFPYLQLCCTVINRRHVICININGNFQLQTLTTQSSDELLSEAEGITRQINSFFSNDCMISPINCYCSLTFSETGR